MHRVSMKIESIMTSVLLLFRVTQRVSQISVWLHPLFLPPDCHLGGLLYEDEFSLVLRVSRKIREGAST